MSSYIPIIAENEALVRKINDLGIKSDLMKKLRARLLEQQSRDYRQETLAMKLAREIGTKSVK